MTTEPEQYPWACPNCGAKAHKRGRKNARPLNGFSREDLESCGNTGQCEGLLCGHGKSFDNPCPEANCYHCGWGGSLPVRPKKLPTWAKKALDAGFPPPKGWTP
jgi:hypothetical protein